MSSRSFLFVPGDSERKLTRALAAGADALILDLEDAVAPENKSRARSLVCEFLSARGPDVAARLWVRVNALDSPHLRLDLAAIMPAHPYGLVLPKADSAAGVVGLAAELKAIEAAGGAVVGHTRLMPILETPRGVLNSGGYGGAGLERVAAMTWGAEDLRAALGARGPSAAAGQRDFALQVARAHCLLAAKAMDAAAIDTVSTDFKDLDALDRECTEAQAEGFSGKLAIHPDQVAIINAAFLPTAEELAWARRVIAVLGADLQVGAAVVDGRMVDRVHGLSARRMLDAHARHAQSR